MTRRQALQTAFMKIEEAEAYSVDILSDHKDDDYYEAMSSIQEERWRPRCDYDRLGELLTPLERFANRVGASVIIQAIENYRKVQAQDFPPEEPDEIKPGEAPRWLKTMPKEDGIYWTYAPPPNKVSLVRIKEGQIHFLETDDGIWEEAPYQLFWSERLIPPMPPANALRIRRG